MKFLLRKHLPHFWTDFDDFDEVWKYLFCFIFIYKGTFIYSFILKVKGTGSPHHLFFYNEINLIDFIAHKITVGNHFILDRNC